MSLLLLPFADAVLVCLLQVCDDEWHHYALNLEFPTVTLYVDGVSYDPALIHDNGLIHPPRPEPSLMIGACWAGERPLPKPCSSGKKGGGGRPREVKETPPNTKLCKSHCSHLAFLAPKLVWLLPSPWTKVITAQGKVSLEASWTKKI